MNIAEACHAAARLDARVGVLQTATGAALYFIDRTGAEVRRDTLRDIKAALREHDAYTPADTVH